MHFIRLGSFPKTNSQFFRLDFLLDNLIIFIHISQRIKTEIHLASDLYEYVASVIFSSFISVF